VSPPQLQFALEPADGLVTEHHPGADSSCITPANSSASSSFALYDLPDLRLQVRRTRDHRTVWESQPGQDRLLSPRTSPTAWPTSWSATEPEDEPPPPRADRADSNGALVRIVHARSRRTRSCPHLQPRGPERPSDGRSFQVRDRLGRRRKLRQTRYPGGVLPRGPDLRQVLQMLLYQRASPAR